MSAVLSSANASNPAVKRIMREYVEFDHSYSAARAANGSIDVVAAPLDDNLFEWHFTLRGPPGSPYAGGLYHGRVLLPSNYPFRPPDIVMLTPSGRFETGKKICLSISSYHPNNWQPSWSIRTALTALSAFFTTPAAGAIGSLDYPDREKQQLAAKSASFVCPHCQLSNAHIMHKHSQAPTETKPGAAGQPATDAGGDTSQRLQATAPATHTEMAACNAALPSSNSSAVSIATDLSRGSPAQRSLQSSAIVQPTVDSASTRHRPVDASSARASDAQPTSADTPSSSSSPLVVSSTARPSSASTPSLSQPAATATSQLRAQPAAAAEDDQSSASPASPSPARTSSPATASSSSSSSSSNNSSGDGSGSSSRSVPAPSSSPRLRAVTLSLAVLVAALLFRKLVAHLLSSHPSQASIVLHSL